MHSVLKEKKKPKYQLFCLEKNPATNEATLQWVLIFHSGIVSNKAFILNLLFLLSLVQPLL